MCVTTPNTHSRILLDTGDSNHPEYIEHLSSVLRSENASITAILLTHWHHDHIGGVGDVVRSLRARGEQTPPVWKYPRTDAPDLYPDAVPQDVWVQPLHHEHQFPVDGATLRVLWTPGHTTDHVCVELDEERALFSGDCILGEGSAVFEDLYEYMNSLRDIEARGPELIYPAHGNVVQSPLPKIRWYIEHREKRERQLWETVQTEPSRRWSAMELVRRVYGAEVAEDLWPAAAYNVQHHLEKLCREGRLEEVKDGVAEGEERLWRMVKHRL